ncbi:MAG TPA: hypothetical protein PL033_07150 [Candidatus Brocadiia bacterium]|nr:hypothetical protein [Candidatus Brocadiia bacterium]
MALEKVKLGKLDVTKFILGGNPFSGFSHQTHEANSEMVHYYTAERIKQVFREAERLGVNTHLGRADHHIMRVLLEYWDEGGTLQWIAQTCPEVGSIQRGIQNGIAGGASACFIHGGVMDNLLANNRLGDVPDCIKMIRDAGLPAGVAGHDPRVFEWAEEHLDCDFYMCCYYNPSSRASKADHDPDAKEWFRDEDREVMTRLIAKLSRPAIHYKIMAAGRNRPSEAFAYAAKRMRAGDAVCVGVFPKHRPKELEEDARLVEELMQ